MTTNMECKDPPKIKNFVWRAVQEGIAVRDNWERGVRSWRRGALCVEKRGNQCYIS